MSRSLRMAALAAFAAFAFTGSAFANSSDGIVSIISTGIHDSGNGVLIASAVNHTEHCATPGWETALVIPKTSVNFNRMYAAALTAQATGRPIAAWVNGCTDIWGNGSAMAPTLTLIYMQ